LKIEKQKNFEQAPPVLLQLVPVEDSLVPVTRAAGPSDPDLAEGGLPGRGEVDYQRLAEEIIAALRKAMKDGDRMYLTQTELLRLVRGNAKRKADILHALADDPNSSVQQEQVGNKYKYFIV
jgi:hypothetical protein